MTNEEREIRKSQINIQKAQIKELIEVKTEENMRLDEQIAGFEKQVAETQARIEDIQRIKETNQKYIDSYNTDLGSLDDQIRQLDRVATT